MTREVGKARGVLRADPGPGAFRHARIAPPDVLADVVAHFWFVGWDLSGHPPQTRETLPHPNVHLVFERGRTRIMGVHTARFTRVLEGRGCALGIKFRAGGFRPFLDRAVSTITEGSVGLTELFGDDAASLEDDVLAGVGEHAMIEVAARFLHERRRPPDANGELAGTIVEDIAADRNVMRVDQVADRHRLGRRALQRLFGEYVGVGPKWVINRYRLHEALERLSAGATVDWSAFALALGYFDQAHFIRDFHRMVGRTPGEYARAANVAAG